MIVLEIFLFHFDANVIPFGCKTKGNFSAQSLKQNIAHPEITLILKHHSSSNDYAEYENISFNLIIILVV